MRQGRRAKEHRGQQKRHSQFGRPATPQGFGRSRGYAEKRHTHIYRARDGKIMGVCKGLAQHFGFSTRIVRLSFIFAAFFTAFWPIFGIYVLLGLAMKPEPVIIPQAHDEGEFYSEYLSSRQKALHTLKERFNSIENRIRHMEDIVTSKEFTWQRRL